MGGGKVPGWGMLSVAVDCAIGTVFPIISNNAIVDDFRFNAHLPCTV